MASRVLTGVYDEELRRSGLPATQFALLAILDRRPGAAQEQLTTWVAMEQSTLSRNLNGLVRRGWVSSAAAPGSRVTRYQATASGRAALRRARPGWQRAQARVKRALGADWNRLAPLLHKLASLERRT